MNRAVQLWFWAVYQEKGTVHRLRKTVLNVWLTTKTFVVGVHIGIKTFQDESKTKAGIIYVLKKLCLKCVLSCSSCSRRVVFNTTSTKRHEAANFCAKFRKATCTSESKLQPSTCRPARRNSVVQASKRTPHLAAENQRGAKLSVN